MKTKVKSVAPGRHSVTPYLIVKGAVEAMEFYKTAFGAVPSMEPLMHPDGRVGHAEMTIGDSVIMLADEFPEMDAKAPTTFGGSPVSLHLYVDDVDKVAKQVTTAGGKVKRPVQDQFYGDRSGTFTDPFGHTWHVATHMEDITPAELRRRAAEAMKQHAAE